MSSRGKKKREEAAAAEAAPVPATGVSFLWSLLYVLGMLLAFVGERAIGAGTARGVLTGLGVALTVAVVVVRLIRMRTVDRKAQISGARATERVLLGLSAVGLAALLIYFLQSDVVGRMLDKPLDQSWPKLAAVMAALWPAAMACSLLPMLMVEVSYLGMARAPVIEAARVHDALMSGLGLAFALIFVFAGVYVATNRDAKWDLSYFRTAKPGEATRKVVHSLEEPLEVALFFPPANDVKEQVTDYFELLKGESPFLQVKQYDQAVDLARAKELGVGNNGLVVFARGQRKELLSLGTRLENARSQLRDLDREAQKRILQVSRSRRVLYFVTGHGERTEAPIKADEGRAPIRLLREVLRSQNHDLQNLSAAEGLAAEVPASAAAVLIIGPTARFLDEEVAALERYVKGGGRVLLALDPEAGLDFKELLAPFGVKYDPVTLAADAPGAYLPRFRQVSDRRILISASFSSHPAVTTLAQAASQAPAIFLGTGALSEAMKERPKELSIDYSVHAPASAWNDLNGNFNFDSPLEQRKTWELAAAITWRKAPGIKPEEEGRMVVLADSDGISDLVLENRGNFYLAADSVKWLVGDESIAGTVTTEVDLPLQHTKKEDVAWFYSTVFLVPALVIGAGLLVNRRRGGRR